MSKEVLETRRSTIRWLALSLGVINPGESRQGAIPVLDAIFNFQFVQKKDPSVPEISEYITGAWEPINDKTLRYHLLQLKKAKLVENSKGKYIPDAAGRSGQIRRGRLDIRISRVADKHYKTWNGRSAKTVEEQVIPCRRRTRTYGYTSQ